MLCYNNGDQDSELAALSQLPLREVVTKVFSFCREVMSKEQA